VDWSDLAQDKEKWQYTPRFHKMQGISWLKKCSLFKEGSAAQSDYAS
jgi:hypothetical protein